MDNWKRYTDDEFVPLQGHNLKYPVEVDVDGDVRSLYGHQFFPNGGGLVAGNWSRFIPSKWTT
ncbi:hypothetical protein CASFOL_021951 [Castilleja foliolosa]|uniref:Phospholipase D C-terminal domain-containing protein n=1 Tax=Castilleja foliolosa TaxID=1961234 RepID=A0ABD3CZM2_9LAMI